MRAKPLITRRSEVRILPPLLRSERDLQRCESLLFFASSVLYITAGKRWELREQGSARRFWSRRDHVSLNHIARRRRHRFEVARVDHGDAIVVARACDDGGVDEAARGWRRRGVEGEPAVRLRRPVDVVPAE